MGEILFEKNYSSPCEDMDDMLSFQKLVETSPIFYDVGEKDRILFNRFAFECALFAERLECRLTVEHNLDGDESILFHFSAERFSFSAGDPMPFTELMKYNTLYIETEDDRVIITATYFL